MRQRKAVLIFSLSFFALVVVLLLQLTLPRRRGDLPRASGGDLSFDRHAVEIRRADVPQSAGDLAFYSTSRGREAELRGISTFVETHTSAGEIEGVKPVVATSRVVRMSWWLIDAVLALVTVGMFIAIRRAVRRAERRRVMGQCPACGYDLRGTQGRCPEWGWRARIDGTAAGTV